MPLLSYQEALEWIHSIGKSSVIRPGLERIQLLLDRMGNPERTLKYIHVGGTNGKGSTASILASMLEKAGYRVGLYTSPYLEAFTNRMSVNGKDISPEELAREVNRLRPLVDEISSNDDVTGEVTEFEVVTALAFSFFASRQPDLVILEVGLGGRYDATNVITPLVSIITNVSREHVDYLGDSLDEIAWQKAGIIKEGVPVVTASDDEEVLSVIRRVCLEKNTSLCRVLSPEENGLTGPGDSRGESLVRSEARQIFCEGQFFDYFGLKKVYRQLFVSLKGDYQVINATTALATLECLDPAGNLPVEEEEIRKGLQEVSWPGRMEVLNKTPLIVIDGAHNPAAVEKLSQAVKEHFSYRRLLLVLGILKDKDVPQMLHSLIPLADQVLITHPPVFRGSNPEKIASQVRQLHSLPVDIEPQIKDALNKALNQASTKDMILVCGSLYVVAEARKFLVDLFADPES